MKIKTLFETKPYSEMSPEEAAKAKKERAKVYKKSKKNGNESYSARVKRRGKKSVVNDTKKAREKDPEMYKAQQEHRNKVDNGERNSPGEDYEYDHNPDNRSKGKWVKGSSHAEITNKRKTSKRKSNG